MRSFWLGLKMNWKGFLVAWAAIFAPILVGTLLGFSLSSEGRYFSLSGVLTAAGVMAGGGINVLIWIFIIAVVLVAAGFSYGFSDRGEPIKATSVTILAIFGALGLGIWWALNGFGGGPFLLPLIISVPPVLIAWRMFTKPPQSSYWRHSPASAVPPPTPASPAGPAASATSQASPPPDPNPDNPDEPKMR